MKKQTLTSALICLAGFCQHNGWAATNLEQITVEGTADQPPSLIETKQTIETNAAPVAADNVSETLTHLPYVAMQKDSTYSAAPYIRGRGTKGVPVYLDGMRLNAGHSDSTNLFSVIDIGSVDVYRGANGATLGMGAMSGAVVARFADPVFSQTGTFGASGFLDAKSALFSASGYSSSLGASVFNDRFSASLSGGLSDYLNYKDGDGDAVAHSGSSTSSYNGSGAVKVTDDSFAYIRYMKTRADSEDPYSRYQNQGVWVYTDRPDDEGEYSFAGYKDTSMAGFKDVDFQVFSNQLHYDMDLKREAIPDSMRELYRESKTTGGKIAAKRDLDEHNLLSVATGYSKMNITNGMRIFNQSTGNWGPLTSALGITDGDIGTSSVNASDNLNYDKLFFTLSGGYENVHRNVHSNVNTKALAALIPEALLGEVKKVNTEADDDLLSAGLTAGYKVHPAFIPYIKIANATRTPYFDEAYGNNPNNGSQIPNQTLDNETVLGMDIGFDGTLGPFYYSSAFYLQEYDNYIELASTGYKTTDGLPIKQYINLDDAKIYGIEALVGYTLGRDISMEAAYIYTYGENESYNQPLAFIAPQKLTLTLAQRQTKGFNWSIQEVLVDNQDRISKLNGEAPTAGYALTNLSISYIFEQWGWAKQTSLAFDLNNAFDMEYRQHLDRVSSTAWYLPNEPGINGMLSLRMQF